MDAQAFICSMLSCLRQDQPVPVPVVMHEPGTERWRDGSSLRFLSELQQLLPFDRLRILELSLEATRLRLLARLQLVACQEANSEARGR